MEAFIPKTSNRAGKHGRPLWMNATALKIVKKKLKSYKRYLETKEGQDYIVYTRARNQATWECRKAARDLEKKIASESKKNPKAFFSYVKSKLKTRSTIPDLIH